MKALLKISLLCIVSLCFLSSISFGQEAGNAVAQNETDMATDDMAAEAEMYFASGTVAEVTASQIVISEYDFDAGQETKVAYQVNSQTQFEGVAAVGDIKAGDDIEIEYQLAGDQKVATRVEKYAPEAMDDLNSASDEVKAQAAEKMNEETQQQLKTEGENIETNN